MRPPLCYQTAVTVRPSTTSGSVGSSMVRADDVRERLGFGRRRIADLAGLNGGDLLGADARERQMYAQEVFFHLVGAIEVFAQLVNDQRALGNASEDVGISRLPARLPNGDALQGAVGALYVNTRNQAVPPEPYDGDGLMFRVWNYRHQVTHRERNPFFLQVGLNDALSLGGPEPLPEQVRRFAERGDKPTERSAHFLIDPRIDPHEPDSLVSQLRVEWDLQAMLELVQERLEAAIAFV
jgi:hypothetical protein